MINLRYILFPILFVILVIYIPQVTGGETKTKVLNEQDLYGLSRKEGIVLTVSFLPGESSPEHRHNAHTFVYVLEGSLVFQVEGGQPVTLQAGDTFYESPTDIHKVSKNASDSQSAKILVFFVKDKNTPLIIPVR
jgi:quercetin dioxygenase-like cupin family protein